MRTRAYVYNTILLDKSIEDRLRGYPSWISSRNLSNEATDEAVQALIDAVVSRYDVPQRYYRLKARLLGLDRIEHFDRFAPVAERGGLTSWDEARRIVVEAYSEFDEQVGEIVVGFFEKRLDRRTRAPGQIERCVLRDDRFPVCTRMCS